MQAQSPSAGQQRIAPEGGHAARVTLNKAVLLHRCHYNPRHRKDAESCAYWKRVPTDGFDKTRTDSPRGRSDSRGLGPRRVLELEEALFAFSIHTGLRWSEQMALRWRDADLLAGMITVGRSKNGSGRQVPMNSMVQSVLLEGGRELLVLFWAAASRNRRTSVWSSKV